MGTWTGWCYRFFAASSLTLLLLLTVAGLGQAQVVGEEAELDRLKAKAEDAMGNDDAESAAMNMGRAALMAAQLGKRQTEPGLRQVFKATEHLYRSQEHGYRGLALFRRAGGELPASAGVCGSLQLAQHELRHAQDTLAASETTDQPGAASPKLSAIRQTADDWAIVLSSMHSEFRCPD
ncbi:MAG: hypothetical protein ABS70_06155 [Nitrospira sp. SCN 59-13]|nr:MAG: hypothetical protein ABS70_06155 [Nitrospira sp. SCN 59-13]